MRLADALFRKELSSSVCPGDRQSIAHHDLKEFATLPLDTQTERLQEKVKAISEAFLVDRVNERNRDEVGRVRALIRALGARLPQYWLPTWVERPTEAAGVH
eukprot:5353518-Amphidinium_carterae.1